MKTRNLFFGLFGIFILATLMSGCSGGVVLRIQPAEWFQTHIVKSTSPGSATVTINGKEINGTYSLYADNITLGLSYYPPDGYYPGEILFACDNGNYQQLNKKNPKVQIKNERDNSDHTYLYRIYFCRTTFNQDTRGELVRGTENYPRSTTAIITVHHYRK